MDQTTQSQDHLLLKTRVDARHRHRFAYQQGRIRARYLFIITDLTRYRYLIMNISHAYSQKPHYLLKLEYNIQLKWVILSITNPLNLAPSN